MISKRENAVKLRVLNRKKLLQLKTKELNDINNILINRIRLICTASLRKFATIQELVELANEINKYIIKAISHNLKQQTIHKSLLLHTPNGASNYSSIKEFLVNQNPIIVSLIYTIRDMQPIDILDIILFEDKFANKSIVNYNAYNNAVINLMCLQKRKLRKKFRNALHKSVLIQNSYLFIYYFRNNKPLVWLYFKLKVRV